MKKTEIMMITTEGIIIPSQCLGYLNPRKNHIRSKTDSIFLKEWHVASFAKVREKDEDKAEKESSEDTENTEEISEDATIEENQDSTEK